MRNHIKNTLRHSVVAAALALLGSTSLFAQRAFMRVVVPEDPPVLSLGDRVTFQVLIDPQSKELSGFTVFLTIDPAVFKPIIVDTVYNNPEDSSDVTYEPFVQGNAPGDYEINSTHGDVWAASYVDSNGIAGFQLDYGQSRAPGSSEYFSSLRTGADFELIVVDLPSDPGGNTTLQFDHKEFQGRNCKFWLAEGGIGQNMATTNFTIPVGGVNIAPAIPDSLIAPGATIRIPLADHFVSGLYTLTDVTWSLSGEVEPGGTTIFIDPADTNLVVTSGVFDHGIVQALLTMVSNDLVYSDTQSVRITVDYPPILTIPLPAQPFTYDEDDSLTFDPHTDIFDDADDSGGNISMWLTPPTPIYVNYEPTGETITFSAAPNWYGNATSRLYIQDALGVTIDTLIDFTVNAVNDTPVVDLDSVGVLLDTVIIHYGPSGADTLALANYISDVDDPYGDLAISASSLDVTHVSATLFSVDSLVLATVGSGWYGDVPVEVTATDDGTPALTGQDTIIVRIEPWPPEIVFTGPIKIDATQDPADTTLDLTSWVNDPDTPPADMRWDFRVLDAVDTTAVDPDVVFTPNNTTMTTVTVSAPSGYRAMDIVEMTVTNNDSYALTDVDTVLLYVFDTFAPMIAPLPDVTIYRDTVVQVLDLDDYVADLVDDPADITWSATWQGQLYSVTIGADHVVTIATNPLYFGPDTVTFTATNSQDSSSTAQMAVRVIPRSEQPPVWEPMPEFVEIVWPDTIPLFILTDMVRDDFLPGNQLVYAAYSDPDPLKPLIVLMDTAATYQTRIAVPGLGNYTTWLYFTAEDTAGNISPSDTIRVAVRDSYSPVWVQMPTVRMGFNETYRDTLSKYLSDLDTPLSSLAITVIRDNNLISTAYDPVTMELVIQSQSKGPSAYITLIANDGHLPIPNTATTRFKVIIDQPVDVTPPEGTLTYFFNPVADRWINYVLVADSTAVSKKSTYVKDNLEVSLTFIPQDTLPGTQIWRAPKEFTIPGTYSLSVDLFDNANNVRTLPLNHTVSLSKAMGDRFTSPDGRLTVSYPALPISEGKLVILAEESLSADLAKQLGVPGDEYLPDKLYALDANLPEPISMTFSTRLAKAAGAYYAFFEVSGDQRTRIETQTDGEGLFEADIVIGRELVFAASEVRAEEGLLPYNDLRLYPNPFNATLQVRFKLRTPEKGRIIIFNILGREVFSTPQATFTAGVNAFQWQGLDQRGGQAPSGLYFIRLVTKGGTVVTRKVMLLK